jgi:hypothetical protein
MGIGDEGLGHLADVQRSLTDLAGRLDAAVREADGATGTDAAGVVDVVLDSSGRVREVTLTQGWRRLVGDTGLTAAIQEASRAAGAEFTRRVVDATTDQPAPRRTTAGASPRPPGSLPPSTVPVPPVAPGPVGGVVSLRDVIDAVRELSTQLAELQDAGDSDEGAAVGRDPAGRVEARVAQAAVQQVTLVGDWWSGASDKTVAWAVTRSGAIRAASSASDQVGARGVLNGRAYRELSAVLSDPEWLSSLFTPPSRRNPW